MHEVQMVRGSLRVEASGGARELTVGDRVDLDAQAGVQDVIETDVDGTVRTVRVPVTWREALGHHVDDLFEPVGVAPVVDDEG